MIQRLVLHAWCPARVSNLLEDMVVPNSWEHQGGSFEVLVTIIGVLLNVIVVIVPPFDCSVVGSTLEYTNLKLALPFSVG